MKWGRLYEHRCKKNISTLLAAVMVFGLFAVMPRAASAADAVTLATTINGHDHGGTGSLNAIASGNTVDVTGTVAGATNMLSLDIDSGLTVVWKASYSGDSAFLLIAIGGEGLFEVASGGAVSAKNGYAIYTPGAASTVNVSGGLVFAYGGNLADVIFSNFSAPVSDGIVTAWDVAKGTVAYTKGSNADLSV